MGDRGAVRWAVAGAVVGTGVVAGLGGAGLTLLLHVVQHAAFGYTDDSTFLVGAERTAPVRRAAVLLAAGFVAGVGWWGFTRILGKRPDVSSALEGEARLPALPRGGKRGPACSLPSRSCCSPRRLSMSS
ncbi:MAG TPA: hypothetical protein VGN54_05240 [Mycobacteriales bacterium]|nr:hypothetical protein [Mycobacteriales bacterium]